MSISGDDGFGGSPTVTQAGETQYVVNQNNPEAVYQPRVGGGANGDLLML